jgi:hypothetical protein
MIKLNRHYSTCYLQVRKSSLNFLKSSMPHDSKIGLTINTDPKMTFHMSKWYTTQNFHGK